MPITSHPTLRRGLLAALLLLALGALALALAPAPGHATGRTETLRFFSQTTSLTLTRADGTVVRGPAEPQPGDVLDVTSRLYRGDHRRHARRPAGSTHLRCTFTAAPEPDCLSHTALRGSLLVFAGNPGTLVLGTGRYEGATGRVVASTEVPGGSDFVARIGLRAR